MPTTQICPKCEREYNGFPALSRRDNKTHICSACGEAEAMEDYTEHLMVERLTREAAKEAAVTDAGLTPEEAEDAVDELL